jgi:hypothetical protein
MRRKILGGRKILGPDGGFAVTVPPSSGPASIGARLIVVPTPTVAAGGGTIRVRAQVEIENAGGRIVTDPGRSELLITRRGRVVGRSGGAPGLAVPVVLRAGTIRPAQALPDSARLVGADGADLEPGEYAVVGVLAYGSDPLHTAPPGGAGRAFALVSEPVPITIG